MRKFSTLDAHVAGEAVRLLVEGAPSVSGRTMHDKLEWVRRHADGMRRSLMQEPRGHAGMHGALLTEPVTGSAHAGLLFMHAAGFPSFSGEAVIAAATLAIQNKLIHAESDELLFDTPAGLVRARPRRAGHRVASVEMTGLPSFVESAGMPVQLGKRTMRADLAFGGELYAIVDSESVGVPIDVAHAAQLARAGTEIRNAIKAPKDVRGTIFTGPARGASNLRSATVLEGNVLKRSPGLAETCALMAVLDAMGLLSDEQTFRHEGVLGTWLEGRVLSRAPSRDGVPASLTPIVEGSAWPTGRHDFEIDEKDQLDPFAI